jgi:gamma-glutamyltranspeptidase/glutathione hydrolase
LFNPTLHHAKNSKAYFGSVNSMQGPQLHRKAPLIFLLLFFTLFAPLVIAAQKPGKHAVASAHPLATQAGIEILEAGGNAFDAAVAVTAALAVVEPYSSGLGGGGFWLIHRASDGYQTMIDGRETTPAKGHRDMYLDDDGNVIEGASMNGPLSAGIPGVPAVLDHLAKKYGGLPLSKTLAPAIRYAENGFKTDEHYARLAGFRKDVINRWEYGAGLFLKDGDVPPAGHVVKQQDLANTLRAIAKKGADGFYRGRVAKRMVKSVQANGGIWTLDDLKNYQVKERKPVVGEYNGIKVTSVPPPSSGGVALMTMLNILSHYELNKMTDADRRHVIVEAMRRAYRDRAIYLGDSDFVDVPVERLTNPWYAEGLRAGIRLDKATPSAMLPGVESNQGGFHTTHFSVLDKDGNRVSATVTVNYPFGSGFVAEGTGVLLNDEMDDFSAKPGVPNAYGLVGAEANAIAPGKRPLSSMSPTFLETDDRVGILGTPGGSRIITMVLLGILEFEKNKPPQDWVSVGRFHHQYLPDHIQYEEGALSQQTIDALKGKGHALKQTGWRYGNMHAILWNKKRNTVQAASDPRGVGAAEVK